MKQPLIAVIIVHYSSLENVRECLLSLRKSEESQNIIPVVVDNGAKEPAQTLIEEFPEWLHFITLSNNLGFTGGNNAGIKYALENLSPDTLILLNDDTTVSSSAIIELHQTLHSHSKYGAVTPKIYFSPGHEYHQSYLTEEKGRVLWYGGGEIDWTEMFAFHRGVDEVDRDQFKQIEPTPFATGCCLAIKPKLMKKLDGFDERYFLYWEDTDLSLRLQRAGYQTIFQPKAVIWHKNAGSSGSGSALHQYYQTRNRFLLGLRFAPWRTRLFLLKQLMFQFRSGNQAVRRAILDVILNQYGKRAQYHQD